MLIIPHRKQLMPLIGALIVGAVCGYAAGMWASENTISSIKNSFVPITQGGTSYSFIQPLLAYRTPEATLLGDYTSLNSSMQSIINSAKSSGKASRVSIYFRDLEAGKWIGINETDTYYPASLLKVPVMIAYDKEQEEDPSIFDQSFTYDPSVVPDVAFEATSTLVAGRPYSVQSLINHMITDSDNGATFTLLNNINPDFLHDVYVALGIQDPGDNSDNYQISARTYSLFFRVLYNATYLSPDASENALKLLSQAMFANGLVAGVPQGTVVAHKYGEHVFSQNGAITGVELSDCGIVYYPVHPYLICVMTSAADLPSADSIIANISHAAYTAVSSQYASTTHP